MISLYLNERRAFAAQLTVSEEFVQTNLDLESRILVLVPQLLVFFPDEGCRFLRRSGRNHITQTDILEALSLSNNIVIWNVYSSWNSRACKCQDFEGGEIWAQESISDELCQLSSTLDSVSVRRAEGPLTSQMPRARGALGFACEKMS